MGELTATGMVRESGQERVARQTAETEEEKREAQARTAAKSALAHVSTARTVANSSRSLFNPIR